VHETDYQFWTSIETAAKAPDDFNPFFEIARNAIRPYGDACKVVTLKDASEVVPGISAILAPGHTVGHTMLRLSSRRSDLLVWGDIVHNAALQFPEPDRALSFDTTISSRRRVFDMVATDRLMIAGAHLPFPGLGHIAKTSADYSYVPTLWNEDL
jgi:glyoxylase-like metal-dependent hydrolase (beta-lactamase superfamily II)